jgi:signal transduction histidine kinase
MDAAPRPPLPKRVPPGGWLIISWCAVITYSFSPLMLSPAPLSIHTPVAPLWQRVLFGVQALVSNLSWAGLAMSGVVVLSAVLLRRWPLPALGLLLAAAIAASSAPRPAPSIASFLIAPAGVAVGFIAATAPRRISIPAAITALGLLAHFGTNWRGDGFTTVLAPYGITWYGNGFTADYWPVAIVIAWLIGQSVRQRRLLAETLRTQGEAAAVTAERLRIASELHDVVAHSIGVIAIQAGAGSRVIGTQTAEARNALATIEATSRETLAGVRRTLGALRRAEPGHAPGQAPPGPTPARMGATPGPQLLRRVLPGVCVVASWCALMVYAISEVVLAGRVPLTVWRMVLGGFAAKPWPLLATAGAVLLSAVLLRRWPLSALVLLLAGAVAAAIMPWPLIPNVNLHQLALRSPAFFLIAPAGVAVGFIAATRPRPISIAAALIALGVLARCAGVGMLWVFPDGGIGGMPPAYPAGTAPVLAVAVTIVIAWLVGQSIRQNRLHAETLRTQTEAAAVTAERLRLARELHDVVAHSIGVIAIQAGAGRRVINTQPAEARNALAAIEATSREALAELRRTLGTPRGPGPRPGPAAAPLDPAPGLADVGQLAATAMRAGVRVDVRWLGQRRPLPAGIDQSAFRIIQEAVTNVIHHAGTGHCQVIIDQRDDELAIEVVDDGRGGTADGGGYGITGMRERAGLLGGQLSAGPRPEGGFRVAARLPLPAPAAAR